MVYNWQCPDHVRSGVDDMTLLPHIEDEAIVSNLKKRFESDWIFTYIGPVLISVNPFKPMRYFTQREVDLYQGAAQYENPPHVYALADNMYRCMTSDSENQCVIISGESGAGKTVAAKYIMNYLSQVSGSGVKAQQVKDVILKSNPLLEAFGNAKTVRNDNSSRFGKYVEILFTSGQPEGGKISNFLLEKSRVVTQNPKERNFHIFYQVINGIDGDVKNQLGVTSVDYYNYLNSHNCYEVAGTDDKADFDEMLEAMVTMGMDEEERGDIFSLVFGILHLGNIIFSEGNNDEAFITFDERMDYPSVLLQVRKDLLRKKLTSRVIHSKWGSRTEKVDVICNVQQAEAIRDALAKGLYSRLFDYLVKRVNEAMKLDGRKNTQSMLNLGILDIYGFEIFQKNGFEQFCINYVNEKLQQIFIELTLKTEQEEYVNEGIAWSPIDYFNNAIVCQLIEEKLPKPGIMAILDDVCASQHGVHEGADQSLKAKLKDNCRQHQHFEDSSVGFQIHHYAGVVNYNVDGFCERNRDIFYDDLIELMQSSQSSFIRDLFPEKLNSESKTAKKRPITAGSKIKSQANDLVKSLMLCNPHYIRCVKPNETKKPRDWNAKQVKHQVEYLGLKENIRIRRAGFAYRRPFEKFLQRYAILTKETWPSWSRDVRQGAVHILKSVSMNPNEYQLGKTKLFIKAPESLFLLEEERDKKFNHFARVIQKAFKKFFCQKQLLSQKEEASDIFFQKKERRRLSLNRSFFGDYLGLEDKPGVKNLIGKRDKVEFAQTVNRFDKKFRGIKSTKRDLVVTLKGIFLIGRETIKDGPNKGQTCEAVTRHIPHELLHQVSLSHRQDDFVILHVANSYDSLLQIPFKTEFVTVLKRLREQLSDGKTTLKILFSNKIDFLAEKSSLGAGKKRTICFAAGSSNNETISAEGILKGNLMVTVAPGLPSTTRPDLAHEESTRKYLRRNNVQRLASQKLAGPGAPLPALPSNDPPLSRATKPSRKAPSRPSLNSNNSMDQEHRRPSVKVKTATSFEGNNTPNPGNLRKQLEDQLANQRRTSKGQYEANMDFLNTPDGGKAHAARQILSGTPSPVPRSRPIPAGGRPKPQLPKKNPRARVIYSYQANDTDEICISEDEIIEIFLEDPSGWWRGKSSRGEIGLFPGSYVEKIAV